MKHLITCQSSLDELWHKIGLSKILCSKKRKTRMVPGTGLKAILIMTQSRENLVVRGLDPDSPTFTAFALISYCCMHEICTFLEAILRALNEIKCHEIKAIDTCRPEAGIRHILAFFFFFFVSICAKALKTGPWALCILAWSHDQIIFKNTEWSG